MENIWAKAQDSISSSFFDQNEPLNFPYHYFSISVKGVGGGSVEKSNVSYVFETNFPCNDYGMAVFCQKMGRYNGKTAELNCRS